MLDPEGVKVFKQRAGSAVAPKIGHGPPLRPARQRSPLVPGRRVPDKLHVDFVFAAFANATDLPRPRVRSVVDCRPEQLERRLFQGAPPRIAKQAGRENRNNRGGLVPPRLVL